ncbi:hypothetical protein KEF29_30700 [Streptomyces tuirus]|uniref:Secreted protein n=1 Tax=Streptomyces tuirus TaxID=68278 RepID=A0A941FCX0_9ACTN|nr:hypothetical protein [Streptomyces tuirus]
MREKLPAVALLAVALVGVLAPSAAAAPLPLPGAGVEPLATEVLNVEGPLINNVSLPTSK